MVNDAVKWSEAKQRINTKITNADFNLVMELHAKHFNHKYKKLCTCNKRIIRLWISQLNKHFEE